MVSSFWLLPRRWSSFHFRLPKLRWTDLTSEVAGVGGIFNAVNPGVEYNQRKVGMPPRKLAYFHKDLADWARVTGIEMRFPPTSHPVNSVKAMRACLVLAPQGKLIPWARAVFQAYFAHDRDISTDAVISDLCRAVDVEPEWLLASIAVQDVKDALRANTDEAIARGAFGSPTMYLDDGDMYFGVDRLQLMRAAMERKRRATADPGCPLPNPNHGIPQ